LEEFSKVASAHCPKLLDILLATWEIVACNDQSPNDLDGEQASFDALNGTALVVSTFAEEGLPALHLAHIYGAQDIENLWGDAL
jgi:hypothetical protein